MWSIRNTKKDARSGRLVFLIECLLNQNARDRGAAESPAVSREVVEVLLASGVGVVQIPCPEIACLGFDRRRPRGQSIRDALETPRAAQCCRQQALATADRIQCYVEQGFEVLAILGGNQASPGCAVHVSAPDETRLSSNSGVFMAALASELAHRSLKIRFRGIRDADPLLLREDIEWLRKRIT